MAKFSIFGGFSCAILALSFLLGGAGLGASVAYAQTGTPVGLSKKVCATSDLPANPSPAQIANCASSSAAIGETVYYVLTVISASLEVQDTTLTDPLPAGFVPIPGAQCLGTVFAQVPPVWAGSVGPGALQPGQSETCIIPGYYTEDGSKVNTASFSATGQQTGQKTEGGDSALIFVDPTKPLPGNLSIEKTADITSGSLNNGQVTVSYTITVTNTGAGDLYTGGYLQVVDNLAALPSSGISFGYTVDYVGCDPSAGTPLCPTEINSVPSGNTTNQSNGVVLGVWEFQPGEAGLIPAGEGFKITYTVTYSAPEGCIEPATTLNGVRNTAYIRFATGQMAFSDMDVSDNTSFTDLEITDHGIDEDCPERAPDELTIEKVQKSPPSGTIVPWGSKVEYRIIVSNPVGIGQAGPGVAGPTVTNIAVTDLLALLPGMPNVTVQTFGIQCLTNPSNCIYNPPPPFNTTINQLSVSVPVANLTVLSLADGQSEEIAVTLIFEPRSCVSYTSDGSRQTANRARIDYQIATPIKHGTLISQHQATTGPVITDHDKVPPCTLKVKKKGPSQILFGQAFTYHVSYANTGPDPIDIGTLLDAIAIDVPNYAAGLTGTYTYSCSTALPNLFQTVTTPTSITIGYNSLAAQGTRLLQTINPTQPVSLPGNMTMDCVFTLTLDQPAANNPYCMGAGDPKLVNAALMDVSHYFNTNLPVPPQAYATTAASLPLCRHVSVTKTMEPPVVAPGGLGTVTLKFHNHSDDPITGAIVSDALNAQMSFNSLLSCTYCAPGQPVTSTNSVSATFGTIPAKGTGSVTFTVKVNGPAPSIVPNPVTGSYEPPPGNWYDQSPALTDTAIIGVFDLYPVQISKSVVNTAPGQSPNGPFSFNVNCSYAYGGHPFTFSGTASVTLPNATATVIAANGTPMKVPAGAVCTFTETGLPAGSGAFGFSAVGYSPAAPSGNAGQLTVVADDRNEGIVENCYGPRTDSPLQVGHVVGGDCPPVVVEEKTEITKVCAPAVPGPQGRPLYAQCTVTATTNGQFPQGMTVSDSFNGSSGDIVLNSVTPATQQWTCDPSPTAAPGPHVCTFVGGTQATPGPNTATFDYTVSFADANEAQGSKNCAILADRERTLAEACTGFEVKDDQWPEFKIDKVCSPPVKRKFALGAAATGLGWFSDCEITIVASGPVSGPITVTDTMGSSPNGTAMIHALTAAGWTCTPMPGNFAPVAGPVSCTIPAGAFPSSGQSVISATVMLPLGETSAKNCASLTYSGQPAGESCTGIEVPVEDSGLKVKKVVVNNAPGSVAGLSFPVMVSCSNSPGTTGLDNLQDGQTKPFWIYIPNTTCTVSEGPMPVTDACGPGKTPVWTESYAPSNVVPLSPNGTLVTITNTLDCRPDIPQGRLLIRKSLDTSAAPGANVAGLTFPVSLTCDGTVQTGQIGLNAPWSVSGLSTSTPCTVAENVAALPTTGICPQGQTASWGVSYIPASATATPTVSGVSVVVVNTLKCTQNPPVRQIFVQKVVVNNAPGSVADLVFPIKVACGPNTPSSNSPMTVGYLDGQTTIFGGAEGDTCTISEGVIPATTACGALKPVWTTKITPSANPSSTLTLTVAASNPPVTVTNTLNCVKKVIFDPNGPVVIDILPNPVAIPAFTLTKTCQPAVPVAGAAFAQAVCTVTVTQTQGTPVNQIVLTENLMSGATGAQIVSLTSPQGWSLPATPFAANAPVWMQLPGQSLVGTPPQSKITAVVQFPNAEAATGSQNCVSLQGLDAEGQELASFGPVCAPIQNGAATIAPDPVGDGPALELTHTLAGPCRADREKQSYICLFTLDVTNTSTADFVGPEVISQSFREIRPLETSGQGEGWSCRAAGQTASCVNGEVALVPGAGTAVTMTFLLPAQRDGGQFTNCARLGVPDDDPTRVLLIQQAAQAFGLDVGQPDGVMGPRTRAAVSQMQERLGLPVTGEVDNALFVALGLRLDKGIAPLCVTADLPPLDDPECRKGKAFVEGAGCQPVPKPAPIRPEEPAEKTPDPVRKPLQCDPETTVLRDGECKCRKEGTVKLTETTCGWVEQ